MAEAMVITNAAGRILTVNHAFSAHHRLRGRGGAGPARRASFARAMQPQSFYDELYAEVLRSDHWHGSTWCRRRDGTVYREWRSVSAVRDADGRVTHFVAVFREVDGNEADARPAKSSLRR